MNSDSTLLVKGKNKYFYKHICYGCRDDLVDSGRESSISIRDNRCLRLFLCHYITLFTIEKERENYYKAILGI